MPIANSQELFSLIKSLTKSEKRNFKLHAGRNRTKGQLKFIELFDILDKAENYNEDHIIKRLKNVPKSKLANLKRHLYTRILSSLRVITISKKPNVELRGLIDYAYILYDKAFYLEALKVLDKAKRHAEKYYLYYMHLTIIEFEKRIESRHITRSGKDKAKLLISESTRINQKVSDSIDLSNIRTHLHGKYIQSGHFQSKEERIELEEFFNKAIKNIDENKLGPIEKVYLFQSYVWYNYILLDFEQCLSYAEKWLQTLQSETLLIERDVDLYLRGFHYVLSSCFHLKDNQRLNNYLDKVESFRKSNYKRFNQVTKITSFQYVHSARLNKVIIQGNFNEGHYIISKAIKRIKKYHTNMDAHRILVFYFKFAWIYLGDSNYSKSIFYLNKIINNELPKLREDLQIYSRLMFLMCHYELDNFDMFSYSIKSFKPYFNKLKNIYPLQVITQDTFLQLADSPQSEHKLIMGKALSHLKELQKNSYYNVSFTYLDLISWLEAKISNKSLADIVKNKSRKKRK